MMGEIAILARNTQASHKKLPQLVQKLNSVEKYQPDVGHLAKELSSAVSHFKIGVLKGGLKGEDRASLV